MSQCPVNDCTRSIASDKLMCRGHWFGTPRELRDELWRAIRQYGWLSTEAGVARAECIRVANQRESAGRMPSGSPEPRGGQVPESSPGA